MLIAVAKSLSLPDDTTEFLKLFASDQEFTSRADLITRCEELELLIDQEREAPKEILRSPQG